MRVQPPTAAALLAVSLVALAPGRAHAQRPDPIPTDPVLARLIEQSLAARPELARARDEARAERERIAQVGALDDPMLELGIQNDGFRRLTIGDMGMSYYSIMARQALPWPGKRGLRQQVAQSGAEQADTSIERIRLSTEADVRRAYLDLLLTRDRLALLDRLEALWQKSAAVARTRYEAGDGAQSDVLRAQLELSRLKQRRWTLAAEERTKLQSLNRLRGKPFDEPVATTPSVRTLGVPGLGETEAALADALARSPELSAARLAQSQRQQATKLARLERYPDFTVSAGLMPRGLELEPMWQLGVGVNLPVFARSKQDRAVAENEARASAATQNAHAVEQVLRLRVHERRAGLEALLESIRLFDDGLLIQSRATAESTLAQYRVGKVTFASVLEANVGSIADEDAYLQSLADAHRLVIAAREVPLDAVALAGTGGMGSASMPGAGPMRSGGVSSAAAAGASTPPTAGAGSSSSMSGM